MPGMEGERKIPVSVGIVVLNRAKTLKKCLDSLRAFEDVYLCDGNSTDGTLDIARAYGVRVEKQFESDEPNQRISSFGETRTRCLNQAQKAWYFRLDSDEELSAEAAKEIHEIVSQLEPSHSVYRIPRKYIFKDQVIDQAITYPNFEIRLFRRDAVNGYVKATHERVDVKPGFEIGTMKTPMYVPLPETYEEFWKKFESGLRFDKLEHKNISIYSWIYGTAHVAYSLLRYTFKLIRTRLSPGNKLPLRYEMARFWYQLLVWRLTTEFLFNRLFIKTPAI